MNNCLPTFGGVRFETTELLKEAIAIAKTAAKKDLSNVMSPWVTTTENKEASISSRVAKIVEASILPINQKVLSNIFSKLEGPENQSQNGETLKGTDYVRTLNGKSVSIYNTNEYLSYYLAAKAPKALAAIRKSIKDATKETPEEFEATYYQAVLAWFNSESAVGIPSIMWARYFTRKDQMLKNSPILPPVVIKKAMDNLDTTNIETITKFADHIIRKDSNVKDYIRQFKPQLYNELQQPHWTAKEMEFYMPPMHQSAFLINNGDSIQDIIGSQEQPDFSRVLHLVSKKELDFLDMNYNSDKPEVIQIKEKLKGTKYLELKKLQNDKMKAYFTKRVDEVQRLSHGVSLNEVAKKGLEKRAPIFLLQKVAYDPIKTLATIDKLLSNENVLANKGAIESLLSLKERIKTDPTKSRDHVAEAVFNFKQQWVNTLANNFLKTTTFITARIPAQGPSSWMAGRIKNFVYSTRNAIMGPLEMLALTGGDYDIDKQSNMTWDVDSMGNVIDWTPYLVGNKISREKLKKDLNDKSDAFKASLIASNAEDIEKKVNKFREAHMNYLSKAIQNYVVSQLTEVAMSPGNAMAHATAVSMVKLGAIKDYLDSFKFSDIDLSKMGMLKNDKGYYIPNKELVDAIKRRQLAIPFVPSNKALYERVNMDGKSGVGIFASALKAYFATYHAWLKNDSVVSYNRQLELQPDEKILGLESAEDLHKQLKYSSEEVDFIKFNNIWHNQHLESKIGVKKDALFFIWKDPATGLFEIKNDIYTVANTGKHMPTEGKKLSRLHSKRAQKAYTKMQFADEDEQIEILNKFVEDTKSFNEHVVESQAWEDLSELLSAATDNAKELILGKIGANSTTSSIIAVMVSLGIDLEYALRVINEPEIKKAVDRMQKNKRIIGDVAEYRAVLKDLLTPAIHSYDKSTLSTEDKAALHDKVKASFNANVPESVITKEFERQLALRASYNPARQILWYAGMADELTKLSRILSINQGMPVNEVDVFNYILSVERVLGGKLEDFVGDSDKAAAYRKKLIKAANKDKVAFNIPYILAKNDHYFSYLKALVKSNNIMASTSFTAKLVYENLASRIPALVNRVNENEFKYYLDFITNVAIDRYYKQSPDNIVNIGEYGTFDLSKPKAEAVGDVPGRYEFINGMLDIVSAMTANIPSLTGNKFLNRITGGESFQDDATKNVVTLLSGINTQSTKPGELEAYKMLLSNIRKSHPQLYNALFHYSLIVNKAGLGKGSISTLFPPETFFKFEKFLLEQEKSGEMVKLISNLKPEVSALLVPFTAQTISTKTGYINFKRKDNNADIDTDYYDANAEEAFEDIPSMEDDDLDRVTRVNYSEQVASDFDVSDVLAAKHRGDPRVQTIVRSRTNGLTYLYNPDLDQYVPITKVVTDKAINFSIDETVILPRDLKMLGYDWGWEIKLSDGSTARLLSLNDKRSNSYNVKVGDAYVQLSGDEIIRYNPQFRLNYQAIRIFPGKFTADAPYRFYKDKGTGELYLNNLEGDLLPVDVKAGDNGILNENDPAIINEAVAKSIKHELSKKAMSEGTFKDLMKAYPVFVNEVLKAKIRESKLDPTSMVTAEVNIDKGTFVLTPQLKDIKYNLEILPDIQKYMLLRGFAGKWATHPLINLETDKWPKFNGSPLTTLIKPHMKADVEVLQNEAMYSQLTVSELSTMLERLEISPNKYRSLLGKDILILGGRVYAEPSAVKDIDTTKFSREIGVPVTVRTKFIKDISPTILHKLGNILNKRFNGGIVQVLSTSDIKAIYGEDYAGSKAFVHNGVVVLNRDTATLDTFLHEMGHMYLAELKLADPDLYTRIMAMVSEMPEMEKVRQAYPELDEVGVAEELFVEMLAITNAEKAETQFSKELEGNDGSFMGKVKGFFAGLFKDLVGRSLGKEFSLELNDTIGDVLNKIGDDILYNDNSALNKLTSNQRKALKLSHPSAVLTPEEAVRMLKDDGFIQWICT